MSADKPGRDLDKEFEALIANWHATPTGDPDPASPPNPDPPPNPPPPQTPPPGVNIWRGPTIWRPPQEGAATGSPGGAHSDDARTDETSTDETSTDDTPTGATRSENTDWEMDPRVGAAPYVEGDLGDDEDDFEPLPVELPPQEDLHFWGIVVGLVGGGLLLLYCAVTGMSRSSWWFLAALALFVGGFVLLVLRQPHERDLTDDGTRL